MSYYAHEKTKLSEAMQWVQNNQATTSLADLADYPKEFVKHALTGFLTTHAVTILAIMTITNILLKRQRQGTAKETRIVLTTETEKREHHFTNTTQLWSANTNNANILITPIQRRHSTIAILPTPEPLYIDTVTRTPPTTPTHLAIEIVTIN